VEVLAREEWEARAASHRARLAAYVDPHLARRRDGATHPVHDFLFSYYSQRPAQLLRWHPGFGVALAQAPERAEIKGYTLTTGPTGVPGAVTTVATDHLLAQRVLLETLLRLLRSTAARPGSFGCFGMHEWAMVYRADETRHPQPLRLGAERTDRVVESHRVACSHFDAFRFFTAAAVPLNALSPGAHDRADFEQPGCLHGGMDLYKHAFRLTPLICSDLVADAFELAWDIRILDMRAAPYDLTGWRLDPTGEPWTPVPVETPEGKAEYVRLQRHFSERAAPIRNRLIAECERLLAACHAAPTPARSPHA
jgi:hypothetical protein